MIPLAPFFASLSAFLVVFFVGRRLLAYEDSSHARGRLVFGPVTETLAALTPQFPTAAARLAQDLKRAGYYKPKARLEYLAMRNAVLLAWLLLTGLAAMAAAEAESVPFSRVLLGGLAIGVLIFTLPRLAIQRLAHGRVRRIERALPDALDIMTMCLTGGLPLHDTLQRVRQEIGTVHRDLAHEFDIMGRQAEAGTLEQALDEFAKRINVPIVNSLTALVSQADQLGTNVVTALGDYADSIRRSHRQRAEERGNKTTVKILFPIALCLAPPVYVVLLGPALLQMRDFVLKENSLGGVLAPVVSESSQNPGQQPQVRPGRSTDSP